MKNIENESSVSLFKKNGEISIVIIENGGSVNDLKDGDEYHMLTLSIYEAITLANDLIKLAQN
jgi:hypothetical protein